MNSKLSLISPVDYTLEIAGEICTLLPERAVYWHTSQTLIVADMHLGKAASFRAAAVPVPRGTTDDTLSRLDTALQRTAARRLVVLGDMMHDKVIHQSGSARKFAAWRASHRSLAVQLIRGNHDAKAGEPPADWQVDCIDAPVLEGPFAFCHEPDNFPSCMAWAGHVHPCVVLHGPGGESMRMPCFVVSSDLVLLPSFGAFTGAYTVRPARTDRIFVVADQTVIRVQ